MKIKVKQNDIEKEFELKDLSALAYAKQIEVRELLSKKEKSNESYTLEEFYAFADSIVLAFDNQFTREELLESIQIWDLILYPALIEKFVTEKTNKKVEQLVKNL